MTSRGLRGSGAPKGAKDYSNLSIDDHIKMGKFKSGSTVSQTQPQPATKIPLKDAMTMSLDEMIEKQQSGYGNMTKDSGITHKPMSFLKRTIEESESTGLDDMIIQTERNFHDETEKNYDPMNWTPPPKYNVEVNGTLGARNTQGQFRRYTDDVNKPLDELVAERGILKPPSYTARRHDDLPITGMKSSSRIRRVSPSDFETLPSTSSLDPRVSSLDEIIEKREVGEGTNVKRFKRSFE